MQALSFSVFLIVAQLLQMLSSHIEPPPRQDLRLLEGRTDHGQDRVVWLAHRLLDGGGILRDYFDHKLTTSGGTAPCAASRKMEFFLLLDKLLKDLMEK